MNLKRTLIVLISTCLFLTFSQAQNIKISAINSPNEPSIMLNPKQPKYMVAGANINSCYISSDTGRTWQRQSLSSSFGVWGDPTIAVDTAGHFYFFHLSNPPAGSWIDRIVCQKSTDNGKTWSNGTFTGLNGTKAQDKQWYAIDPKTNHIYLTWTQFDKYDSTNPADSSHILFSKSVDAGKTWTKAKRINTIGGDCLDSDNTVEGAMPAIGPNGEVYVAWVGPNGLVFNKSLDGGQTWLEKEQIITSVPGGWDMTIPEISRCNGLPITVCDLSNGPNRGTIYINWSDQRNGLSNTDIWLIKSTDGGATWSAPIKVNNDNSNKHQFFTWMAIDQTNGNLYFVFYDRRNYSNFQTDVYLAISTDGGNTFINKRISESPFTPNANIFFGDYTNIVAHNNIVRPIWTRLHNGELSVWTNISPLKDLLVASEDNASVEEIQHIENYPNPSKDITYISYKIHNNSKVSLSLFNNQGEKIAQIINNETREYGKYIEKIDMSKFNISNGVYFLQLDINNKKHTVKQVKID